MQEPKYDYSSMIILVFLKSSNVIGFTVLRSGVLPRGKLQNFVKLNKCKNQKTLISRVNSFQEAVDPTVKMSLSIANSGTV